MYASFRAAKKPTEFSWLCVSNLPNQSRCLFAFGFLDQTLQARFLPPCGVLVDNILRASFVQFFGCDFEFCFGSFDFTGSCCGDDFLDLSLHRSLDGFVAFRTDFVLAKSLTGTGCIWHWSLNLLCLHLAGKFDSSTIWRFSPVLSTAVSLKNLIFTGFFAGVWKAVAAD